MQDEQFLGDIPKKPFNKTVAIIVVVVAILAAAFMIPATLFACHDGWYPILFACVIPWLILNYWFGKALVVLQQYCHSDYIKRARYTLILIQLIVTVLGFIINIVAFNVWWTWPSVWRAALLTCVLSSLIGFISAYIAIHNYPLSYPIANNGDNSEEFQGVPQPELAIKNIPKRIYKKTSTFVTVILYFGAYIGTAAMLFASFAPFQVWIVILFTCPFVILWMFIQYHFGLMAAKRNYDKVVSGQAHKIYLQIAITQAIFVIIAFCLVFIWNSISNRGFTTTVSMYQFDCPVYYNIFVFIPMFIFTTTCGYAFSYRAVHTYCRYVRQYNLPKPS